MEEKNYPKGRGKFPFGPLKGKGKSKGKRWFPLGKGKGKGKSKGGKSAHTGKGKGSRPRCWNCGQHGHVEKDCRNVAAVTEESEELNDDWTNDVTEYYDEDWMDWTGALTDDWSYGFDYDWTQLDWYDDSDWYDYGWTDNWTWSTGSDSTGASALSQPASSSTAASSTSFTGAQSGQTAPPPNVSALHSTVNVTDSETGETMTHSPSRRTGTVTRPVRTGTGLLSAFVSVIAVMNSFGKPQGLPLIPETVSSPVVSTTDEYDDVLGRHPEDCISSLSPKERWILFDLGAAAHCCPRDCGYCRESIHHHHHHHHWLTLRCHEVHWCFLRFFKFTRFFGHWAETCHWAEFCVSLDWASNRSTWTEPVSHWVLFFQALCQNTDHWRAPLHWSLKRAMATVAASACWVRDQALTGFPRQRYTALIANALQVNNVETVAPTVLISSTLREMDVTCWWPLNPSPLWEQIARNRRTLLFPLKGCPLHWFQEAWLMDRLGWGALSPLIKVQSTASHWVHYMRDALTTHGWDTVSKLQVTSLQLCPHWVWLLHEGKHGDCRDLDCHYVHWRCCDNCADCSNCLLCMCADHCSRDHVHWHHSTWTVCESTAEMNNWWYFASTHCWTDISPTAPLSTTWPPTSLMKAVLWRHSLPSTDCTWITVGLLGLWKVMSHWASLNVDRHSIHCTWVDRAPADWAELHAAIWNAL